jgi:hypothetical protein
MISKCLYIVKNKQGLAAMQILALKKMEEASRSPHHGVRPEKIITRQK